nr:MAG TPA: hypothetical protein [Caudoviricetes sp.]
MSSNIPTDSHEMQPEPGSQSQAADYLPPAARAILYPLTAALYALVKIAGALGWVPDAVTPLLHELVSALVLLALAVATLHAPRLHS